MDEHAITEVLRAQAGVISRRQVLDLGGTDDDIARLLRRRAWATVRRGVYVDHTGPLTWDQRAWAAVLHHWPAVLSDRSAMRAHRMRVTPAVAPDREPIDIAVAAGRRIDPGSGIRVRRMKDLDAMSQPHARPPRLRLEHAVLLAASRATRDDAAVAILADACQEGRTTPRRLAAALAEHPRLRHRAVLQSVLADVGSGVRSALEHRYLVDVERAHGLPQGARQSRSAGPVYRDVRYGPFHLVVELDGQLVHGRAEAHWADLDRDLAAAATGDLTVRVVWGQVLDPCRLAAAVGRLLKARGWDGHPVACGPGCPIGDEGGLRAPGADKPPSSPA